MKKKKNHGKMCFIAAAVITIVAVSCKKEKEEQVIKDIDGNVYTSVTIGTQVWFAGNLKTTKYNDGTEIPLITGKSEWDNLTTDAFCWYDNNASANKGTYGALYNWYAVGTGKLCPDGWHVPTDAEWTTLTDFIGGEYGGGKLKEAGTTHWIDPNVSATNEYGFNALPAGDRYPDTGFEFWGKGIYGAWWSSTEIYTERAYYREIYNEGDRLYREYTRKSFGFSVRCLKD